MEAIFYSIGFVSIWSFPVFYAVWISISGEQNLMKYASAICIQLNGFVHAIVWTRNDVCKCCLPCKGTPRWGFAQYGSVQAKYPL